MSTQNFCTECGASLNAGQKFCTACGSTLREVSEPPQASAVEAADAKSPARSPVESTSQPIVPSPAPTQTGAAQAAPAPRPKRRGGAAIAALSVVFVAVIALAALIGTGVIDAGFKENPGGDEQAMAENARSGDDKPAPAESDADEADADETSQQALADTSEDAEGEAQDVPATNVDPLSLDNEDDYFRINLFLSNFSEINSLMNGYRNSSVSSDQVFQFAYAHAVLNSSSAVQLGEYWPTSGGGPYSSRASFDPLKKYAELFLKETLTPSDVPSDACYENGFVYITPEQRGPEDESGTLYMFYPEGIALATGLECLGNNQYQIEFETYCDASGLAYDVTNESYYHMTPQELAQAFGQRFPSYVGTATIEAGYDEEAAPFKLLSYDSIHI